MAEQIVINRRRRRTRKMAHILRTNGLKCYYCFRLMITRSYNSKVAPSRDHVIPLSRGGSNDGDNIVICCRMCNEIKGKLTGEEYTAWLSGSASRLDMPLKTARKLLAKLQPSIRLEKMSEGPSITP